MTPAARIAAAIEILDGVVGGDPAEKLLTNWARRSRFAGSKDRAAIRDHVFDALRCWRSYAYLGGAETGRGLMIGALRAAGTDPSEMFTGEGHAPSPLTEVETTVPDLSTAPEAVRLDCPDWLVDDLRDALGGDFQPVMEALRHRAPVFLRVNTAKASVEQAQQVLADDGVTTRPHPLSPTALEVVENPRRVQMGQAYQTGMVELQDAASQAVVDMIPLRDGLRVLDYCAGGGGKTLAMAARAQLDLFAHDADFNRMRDLPDRAARAGAAVHCLRSADLDGQAGFDLVLTDVPCSGSGAWRRSPEGKWALTRDALSNTLKIQSEILQSASVLVRQGGVLAYATCSMIRAENQDRVAAFLAENTGWTQVAERAFTPLDGGDGFYAAILKRK